MAPAITTAVHSEVAIQSGVTWIKIVYVSFSLENRKIPNWAERVLKGSEAGEGSWTHVLWGVAEEAGIDQRGEKEAEEGPSHSLQHP